MGLREKLPGIRSERRTVRWASYIGYLFLAMIVIGALAPSNQSTSSTGTTDSTNELIEKPATDLVIQGQDLPTTWEYEQIQGGDVNASRSASLVDADLRTAYTIENSITVYNSTEKAKSRYQSKIKSIKEDRGYKKSPEP